MSLKLGLRNKIRRSRAAGGFVGLLDQPFATGAAAAYSLRRLKSTATKAVRVREDSGNTETDIGFSGGTLDETALLNHCGSANGFVTKWYDQSGNSNDASQNTASSQPKIVSSGTVVKDSGKPTVEFINDTLSAGNVLSLQTSGTKSSFYAVGNPLAEKVDYFLEKNNEYVYGFYDQTGSNGKLYFRFSTFGGNSGVLSLSDGLSINNPYLISVTNTAGTGGEIYKNGSLYQDYTNSDTSSATNNDLTLGKSNGEINISEILVYEGQRHDDTTREKIETNINNHYSIF